jgi:hypothetical protein
MRFLRRGLLRPAGANGVWELQQSSHNGQPRWSLPGSGLQLFWTPKLDACGCAAWVISGSLDTHNVKAYVTRAETHGFS